QFEGKTLGDVDDSEFAEVVRQRNEAARARAPLAGGAETGAGPIHWFENYDAKNSRAWLMVDPVDGRIPPTTPEAQKRAADRAARGHWEGNTLGVETTNFRDPNRGASEKLHLVEHFKSVAPNKVEWSVTYDDAATWARPWTFAMTLTKDSTQAPFEYACHEGNYGLRNILSAARSEERTSQTNDP